MGDSSNVCAPQQVGPHASFAYDVVGAMRVFGDLRAEAHARTQGVQCLFEGVNVAVGTDEVRGEYWRVNESETSEPATAYDVDVPSIAVQSALDFGQGIEDSRDVGGQDGDDAPSESSSDADIFDPRWAGMSV
jgi:hypothetical protein